MNTKQQVRTRTRRSFLLVRYWQFSVSGYLVLWQRTPTLRGGVQDGLPQCLN